MSMIYRRVAAVGIPVLMVCVVVNVMLTIFAPSWASVAGSVFAVGMLAVVIWMDGWRFRRGAARR